MLIEDPAGHAEFFGGGEAGVGGEDFFGGHGGG
jgi:hypothetical protein